MEWECVQSLKAASLRGKRELFGAGLQLTLANFFSAFPKTKLRPNQPSNHIHTSVPWECPVTKMYCSASLLIQCVLLCFTVCYCTCHVPCIMCNGFIVLFCFIFYRYLVWCIVYMLLSDRVCWVTLYMECVRDWCAGKKCALCSFNRVWKQMQPTVCHQFNKVKQLQKHYSNNQQSEQAKHLWPQ